MNLRNVAVAAAGVAASAGAVYYFTFVHLSNTEALCEAHLVELLRSPSTYERIKIARASFPVQGEEEFKRISLEKHRVTTEEEAREKGIDLKPIEEFQASLHNVRIEYDAANAFGTPLRGVYSCSYFDPYARGERKMTALNLYRAGDGEASDL